MKAAAREAFVFWTPAQQQDFANDPAKQARLNALWNTNLNGFIQQAITGDPWNATNASGITNYFNPLETPIPAGSPPAQITWNAFPGRIGAYNTNDQWGLNNDQILELGDTGYYHKDGGQFSFPPITKNPCSGDPEDLPYGPYGPRGWQDEYCEWSVRRNAQGQITRVGFTCENPEYWNSLWMIDPPKVIELYRSTLDKPQISDFDLVLRAPNGSYPIDPSTGRLVYNPLNRWNSGPVSSESAGGAMHLTSTPNTIQTETWLAAAATIQRIGFVPPSNQNGLICCADYGQIYRNSDPHIGASVNAVVGGFVTGNQSAVTLANPPGLYIQTPSWSGYQTPDNTPASTFWRVVRGSNSLNGLPGNFILHAVFEVPASYGYTVSDIKINGKEIQWAGQIAQTFNVQIVASAIDRAAPAPVACVGDLSPSLAQPLQLFHQNVFNVMNATDIANPVGQSMTLVSNSTLIAPMVQKGTTAAMILTASGLQDSYQVLFDGKDITATIDGSFPVEYAVPGNTYPGPATAIRLTVNVSANARLGLHNVYVTNSGQSQGPAMPAVLNVVESIGQGVS